MGHILANNALPAKIRIAGRFFGLILITESKRGVLILRGCRSLEMSLGLCRSPVALGLKLQVCEHSSSMTLMSVFLIKTAAIHVLYLLDLPDSVDSNPSHLAF